MRRALFRAVEGLCRAAGGRALYRAVYLRRPRLRVRREDVRVEGLPAELDGFAIAHLTDFHGGPFLRAEDLTPVVELVNGLEPDAVVLTGDFVTHRTEEGLELVPAFGGLRARRGVYAVFGNHDYRGRREGEIAAALEMRGVRVLRNAHAVLTPGLVLAGIEDLEEGKPADLDAALEGAPPGARILLSHHPGGLTFARGRGVALVLSGHTHGGQVRWPGLASLGPAHPGDRLDTDGTTLVVNRGVGVIGVPLRFGAPPEVVVARLTRGP
jgi:predicted MPP superfamily phosphohydrolase